MRPFIELLRSLVGNVESTCKDNTDWFNFECTPFLVDGNKHHFCCCFKLQRTSGVADCSNDEDAEDDLSLIHI